MFPSIVIVVLGALERPAIAYHGNCELALVQARHHLVENLRVGEADDRARPGAVIASPSGMKVGDRPNYFYHWIRDAGLVMQVVAGILERIPDRGSAEARELKRMLLAFRDFSIDNQQADTPAGLGEPKLHVDGRAFTEPWGRPQNDGPAVRALALIAFANLLIEKGFESLAREFYAGEFPAKSVIKVDLEYVSHNIREWSFDYWEEFSGFHFQTRMVQRRALLEGAALAERLGDQGAADWYRGQAQVLEEDLEAHWDEDLGIVPISVAGDQGEKLSKLDVGVVLGVLHGEVPGRSFSILDDRVMATAHRIEEAFAEAYPDLADESLGTPIGRYPEDAYDGIDREVGRTEGGPWFLATHAFAEYHYRLAHAIRDSGEFEINQVNREFFESLLGESLSNQVLRAGSVLFARVIEALREKGDSFLRRSQHHSVDGRMSEQYNRVTGEMQGARDLTWSYSSLITALWAREGL